MLFNSFEFFIFFFVVYLVYLSLRHKQQNLFLLIASYFFYGCWDWRFLSLILLSTVVDYICGLKIHHATENGPKKKFLVVSIAVNLSILGFFKYFDFFSANFAQLLRVLGLPSSPATLNIILPVGISFYTFQTMSYSIDIYRKKMAPTKDFLDFALFVAFFPQLVAGPIERAHRLLPQILNPRKLSRKKVFEGGYLIFWGLFLKIFMADQLATYVDPIFADHSDLDGPVVLFAVYAFAFQIFSDFAGYSCIARGLGKLLGFDIMFNFNNPYFSSSPREFWQRWHISLSSWLRDYLYIPLGGNRQGPLRQFRNLMVTMVLGGLWHGAAWTFVLWGAYHGLLLILYRMGSALVDRFARIRNLLEQRIFIVLRIIVFFHLTCLGWIFFRSKSLRQIQTLLMRLVHPETAIDMEKFLSVIWEPLLWMGGLLIYQYLQYRKNDLLVIFRWPAAVRGAIYFILYVLLVTHGVEGGKAFMYFQF